MSSTKARLIEEILTSTTPHEILGLPSSAPLTPQTLRRAYLTRSRIIHPDKPPFHPSSTLAFQRLSDAYQTLLSTPPPSNFSSLLHDILLGDFALIRRVLAAAGVREAGISSVEDGLRKIVHWAGEVRAYSRVVKREYRRVGEVGREVREVGWNEWGKKARGGWRFVRVGLAVPVRVDREVRRRRRRKESGLLSERVVRVLEFIVGDEVNDAADEKEGVEME